MAIGADPITAAVITMAGVRGLPLKGFLVRKEAKGHGTNRYIEGPVSPGDDVVIVEDVVTTGGSSLEAIERVEAFGLKVTRVVAIIDRMEGGAEAFAAKGYPFSSLLTIRDFGIEPPQVDSTLDVQTARRATEIAVSNLTEETRATWKPRCIAN